MNYITMKCGTNITHVIRINPFVPNAPFLYPMKTPETVNFSNIFKGQKKGALGTNGLNVTKDL